MDIVGSADNSNNPPTLQWIRPLLADLRLKYFMHISHFVKQSISKMCIKFQDVIKVLGLQRLQGYS